MSRCWPTGLSSTSSADTSTTSYAYDLADRLDSITQADGSTVGFTFDAQGRHATRTSGTGANTTTLDSYSYLGSTDSVIVDVSAAPGGTTLYAGIDVMGDRLATSTAAAGFAWIVPDLHGNVVAQCDLDGTLTDVFRYDAYGNAIGNTMTTGVASPWRYQGRILESTAGSATYDFGARAYVPDLGTFTSLDSLAGSAQNPLTLNRYLYAGANPVTMVDPDGHCARVVDGDCINGSARTQVDRIHANPRIVNRDDIKLSNSGVVSSNGTKSGGTSTVAGLGTPQRVSDGAVVAAAVVVAAYAILQAKGLPATTQNLLQEIDELSPNSVQVVARLDVGGGSYYGTNGGGSSGFGNGTTVSHAENWGFAQADAGGAFPANEATLTVNAQLCAMCSVEPGSPGQGMLSLMKNYGLTRLKVVTPNGTATIDRVSGTIVVEGEPWTGATEGTMTMGKQWTLKGPLVEEPVSGGPTTQEPGGGPIDVSGPAENVGTPGMFPGGDHGFGPDSMHDL